MSRQVPAVVETAWPSARQRWEAIGWSALVRVLLASTSVAQTLWLLDKVPTHRSNGEVISIPTEAHFSRAGACLGRQLARSQYLRRRGHPATVVIGVLALNAGRLDAHAWLDHFDQSPGHVVLHRIGR